MLGQCRLLDLLCSPYWVLVTDRLVSEEVVFRNCNSNVAHDFRQSRVFYHLAQNQGADLRRNNVLKHFFLFLSFVFLKITIEAMKSDIDEVALQGIEFWSNVCDEEMDLAIEASEVSLETTTEKRQMPVSICMGMFLNHMGSPPVPQSFCCCRRANLSPSWDSSGSMMRHHAPL